MRFFFPTQTRYWRLRTRPKRQKCSRLTTYILSSSRGPLNYSLQPWDSPLSSYYLHALQVHCLFTLAPFQNAIRVLRSWSARATFLEAMTAWVGPSLIFNGSGQCCPTFSVLFRVVNWRVCGALSAKVLRHTDRINGSVSSLRTIASPTTKFVGSCSCMEAVCGEGFM